MERVRTKGPGWIIRSEERVKVGRLTMGESLEGERGDFENNSLPDGKPVETMKGRGDVVKAVITRKDDASEGILNSGVGQEICQGDHTEGSCSSQGERRQES